MYVILDKTLIDMKSKKPYSGKAIPRSVLMYATILALIFSTACKKNMESQADMNADLKTTATVTSTNLTTSQVVENNGLNYYVQSSGGVVELAFNYSGATSTGYVTLSGSALGSTQYYSVSLNTGSNSIFLNVTANQTGSINASININGTSYSLGSIHVYIVPAGTYVTPMPPTVHLSSYYKTTINAGDPGTLHLIFNWPAMPNSKYDGKMVFGALKTGPIVSLNTIQQPYTFQEFNALVADGTMHMTWSIPANTDGQYLQVAFTTDYLNLQSYFDTQHNYTVNNMPSDPFWVTGLQSGPLIFNNIYSDINVLKIINGYIFVY